MEKNRILITGAAGFIGAALSHRLLDRGDDVFGIDNLNDYYDVNLKLARLQTLQCRSGFHFAAADIADKESVARLFEEYRPTRVVNLAAQAGVRYSLVNPGAYIGTNLVGFGNILEQCRRHEIEHLVFASSSSVYGGNAAMPFSVHHTVDHPLSLYAATKKSNELMAHTYSHIYGLPTTGLRFFTVYGPWGRPDMALFKFAKNILAGSPIEVFNHGRHRRDFTFIDDVVEGVVRVLDRVPQPDPEWNPAAPDSASSNVPYRIYNIGNNRPVELLYYIEVLEECLGRRAEKLMLGLQPGDVPETFADIDDLARDTGFRPQTTVEEGVRRFADWYLSYYQ